MVGDGRYGRVGADRVTLLLAESRDVIESLGRENTLAERFASANPDAPRIETMTVPAWRADVLADRLQHADLPSITPAPGLQTWLELQRTAPTLPDDAVLCVMSVSDALTARVVRVLENDRLLQLPDDYADTWNDEQRAWLDEHCAPAPLDIAELAQATSDIAALLKARECELLTFNVSTYVPDEVERQYRGSHPESFAVTASRLNLMLDSLPDEAAHNVLDVDRIVAEIGGQHAVLGPGRYTEEALAEIAEEAAALVLDIPDISRRFSPDTMRLSVPRYDRRTKSGVLLEWHRTAPTAFGAGDVLFDVRFDNIHTRLNPAVAHRAKRSLRVSVVATRAGFLSKTLVPVGGQIDVGTTVGVVTDSPNTLAPVTEPAAKFPVGVSVATR